MTKSKRKAENYADAVLGVLAQEFPQMNNASPDRDVVHRAISRHATTPTRELEVIVDSPGVANWRLRTHPQHADRVRLACYRPELTEADQAREHRINTALAQI